MTTDKKPVQRGKGRPPSQPEDTAPPGAVPKAADTVVEAGPVAIQVDAGKVNVVVAPPAPAGIDRRVFLGTPTPYHALDS